VFSKLDVKTVIGYRLYPISCLEFERISFQDGGLGFEYFVISYCVVSKSVIEFFSRFNGSISVSCRCTVSAVDSSWSCFSKLSLNENSASLVGSVSDDTDG